MAAGLWRRLKGAGGKDTGQEMEDVVTFADFMGRALHDPARGYYARQIQTVGARGDFSTTATLSSLLGKAIAGWLRKEAALQPDVRHVMEIGAGTGELMAAVRRSLGWWARRRFRWHIVDTSSVLQSRQRELLGVGITWHEDLKTALAACEGKAFLYHNELLDAFPATLLQWQEAEKSWSEVWITPQGQEVLRPLDWDDSRRVPFAALTAPAWRGKAPRQRVELHATVRDWLRHWAPAWTGGTMLTVDYGDLFPALYHRRPAGTVRAYLRHQRLEGLDVYRNPGRQDITADVNFSDYRAWAHELGWQETSFGGQAEFIRSYVKTLPDDAASLFILHPSGAGEAFKHIVHRRCSV